MNVSEVQWEFFAKFAVTELVVNITVSPVVMDVVDFLKEVFEGKILINYSIKENYILSRK